MAETLVEKPPSRYFQDFQSQSHTRVLAVGRPKGRRNTQGVKVREAIEKVFSGMGGWNAMMAWAKDNPSLFYASVVPKLLPAELAEQQAKDGSGIRVLVYAPQTTDKPLDIVIPAPTQLMQADEQADEEKHSETT